MKRLIFIISVVLLTVSCSNNDEEKIYKSEGVIQGFDISLCACCGGVIVEIENKSYRFFGEFPKGSNINMDDSPIKVKLDWDLKSESCDNFITISAIEVID